MRSAYAYTDQHANSDANSCSDPYACADSNAVSNRNVDIDCDHTTDQYNHALI